VCAVTLPALDKNAESANVRRILTAVPQSDWKTPAGRPHTSWLATMKNNLSYHNLSVEDATELALADHSEGYWSKWRYALKWSKANNDDDDDVLIQTVPRLRRVTSLRCRPERRMPYKSGCSLAC